MPTKGEGNEKLKKTRKEMAKNSEKSTKQKNGNKTAKH